MVLNQEKKEVWIKKSKNICTRLRKKEHKGYLNSMSFIFYFSIFHWENWDWSKDKRLLYYGILSYYVDIINPHVLYCEFTEIKKKKKSLAHQFFTIISPHPSSLEVWTGEKWCAVMQENKLIVNDKEIFSFIF